MLLLLALSSLPPSPPSSPSTAWHLADCDSGSEITAAADCQVRLPLVMLRSEHMLRSVANASSSGTTATPASTHPAPFCSPRLRLNHCGLVPCPRSTPAGNSPMQPAYVRLTPYRLAGPCRTRRAGRQLRDGQRRQRAHGLLQGMGRQHSHLQHKAGIGTFLRRGQLLSLRADTRAGAATALPSLAGRRQPSAAAPQPAAGAKPPDRPSVAQATSGPAAVSPAPASQPAALGASTEPRQPAAAADASRNHRCRARAVRGRRLLWHRQQGSRELSWHGSRGLQWQCLQRVA